MKRKAFLATAGTLATGIFNFLNAANVATDETVAYKVPPYLKKGDSIGITASAGFITIEEVQPAVQQIESWGYKVVLGRTIGKRDGSFGGTDVERTADLQQMLDDKSIKAIMLARGGYGAVRIVDAINWKAFKQFPKWIVGFSDATALHSHIHKVCNVASVHAKMTNSFPDNWAAAEPVQRETILSIKDALEGKALQYKAPANLQNKAGKGTGLLVGGNLKTLETLAGTASDIATAGKILFVEDTGEYLYSIDRMMWNLKRTGKLHALKGLIIGGFKIKPDDPGEEFGRSLQDIVLEKTAAYSYPVCFDFPVGHQRANYALKCGVVHHLQVAGSTTLTEAR